MDYTLSFTLIRFEQRIAVIYNDTIGEIQWPIKNLPEDLQIDDKFTLKAISPESQEQEQVHALQQTLELLIN